MSDSLTLRLDPVELARVLRVIEDIGPKAKFAASVGMNRTANEMQDAIRDTLPGHFTLRREQFILQTIYRKPGEDFASKDHLQAGVRIHEERDVLAKFEAGGIKTPTGGRRALAIPIDVKRNKSDIVTPANRVRALLASGKAFIKDGRVWQVVGRGASKRLRLAYVFKPSVKLPADLHFVETGTKVALDRFAPNVAGAIHLELERGLTSKSGA